MQSPERVAQEMLAWYRKSCTSYRVRSGTEHERERERDALTAGAGAGADTDGGEKHSLDRQLAHRVFPKQILGFWRLASPVSRREVG